MRWSASLGWLWISLSLLAGGCNQNPFLAAQQPAVPPATQPASPYAAQLQDMGSRATALDADNRDLHAEIARFEQEKQLLQDEVALLRKRLTDTATQLRDSQLASQTAAKKIEAIQASSRRGGATITANNSRLAALQVVDIPGFEVQQDGDVIRVEVPADRLFHARTAQLLPSAAYVLDQLSEAITRQYPQQMIGVEAHTDNSPAGTGSNHELAASQASAVYVSLTQRNRIPSDQLFLVSHGANQPRVSNATPSGRSKNRRIELVIYPETVRRS